LTCDIIFGYYVKNFYFLNYPTKFKTISDEPFKSERPKCGVREICDLLTRINVPHLHMRALEGGLKNFLAKPSE
jgi:hypothetical protein